MPFCQLEQTRLVAYCTALRNLTLGLCFLLLIAWLADLFELKRQFLYAKPAKTHTGLLVRRMLPLSGLQTMKIRQCH